MNSHNDNFRSPVPSDVMDCVRYGFLSYGDRQGCDMWLRIAPSDEVGKILPFNGEVIASLLKYGFRLCFYDVRQKIIKIGEHNLGKKDFFIAESMHGKKFMIFSCGMSEQETNMFIGIVAL